MRIQVSRSATSLTLWSWRIASRSAAGLPVIARSISKIASIRCTAASAMGATKTGLRPCALRFALLAMSASSKNFRLE